MSQFAVPAPVPNSADVDGVLQSVRFELYRENIYGAPEIVGAAHAARPRSGAAATRSSMSAPSSSLSPRPDPGPRPGRAGAEALYQRCRFSSLRRRRWSV